ncbi:hypothetical protein [Ralstonia sp. 1B3]
MAAILWVGRQGLSLSTMVDQKNSSTMTSAPPTMPATLAASQSGIRRSQ